MSKRMIPAMFVCFFGAALAAACDPCSLPLPGLDGPPTIASGDDIAAPGDCAAAKTEQACVGALTCRWSEDRCSPLGIAGAP